jgi:hypothetical protein
MHQAFDGETGYLSGEQLGNLRLINSKAICRVDLPPAMAPNRFLECLQQTAFQN